MSAVVTPHTDPGAFIACVALTFGLLLPLAAKAIRWAWPDDEFDGIEQRRALDRALAEIEAVHAQNLASLTCDACGTLSFSGCSEWCYPTIPCKGCEVPQLEQKLMEANERADKAERAFLAGGEP